LGIVGLGLGLIGLLGANFVESANLSRHDTEARRWLLVPGEDDITATARAVNQVDGLRRDQCHTPEKERSEQDTASPEQPKPTPQPKPAPPHNPPDTKSPVGTRANQQASRFAKLAARRNHGAGSPGRRRIGIGIASTMMSPLVSPPSPNTLPRSSNAVTSSTPAGVKDPAANAGSR